MVSVIIPCYNQAEYLPDAINSVLLQTCQCWECIIVNDGSTDNTDAVAKALCEKDPRIKYLCQKNSGVSKARNNGIAASKGEFIIPLDADDMIAPEFLEKAVGYLTKNSDCSLFYSRIRRFGSVNDEWNLPEYNWDMLKWGNVIPVTAMYRRCDFNKTKGYNPNMVHGFEDWDFWLSFLNSDSKVYMDNSPMLHYRIKLSSRAVSNDSKENITQSFRQIVKNHKELYLDSLPDIINLHNDSEQLQKILSSKSYKIGEDIAGIYRKIRYRE